MTWLSDSVLKRLREVAELPDLSQTNYRCIRKIASGGMGSIFLVEDTALNRNAALKALNIPDPDEDLSRRMLAEAKIIARLEHPGIVPVHDVGTLPDGRIFYTMKFVQGERLDHHVAGLKGIPEKLRVFQKICQAVAFAHSRSIIHRDLKPENIMVGDFGEVLVMDWGVAKILKDSLSKEKKAGQEPIADNSDQAPAIQISEHETQAGSVIGTPAYMAPEQAAGNVNKIDERSDIYALGVILKQILNHHSEENGEHRTRPTKLPKQLVSIYKKALSQKRSQRYQTASAMEEDTERFLLGQSVSAYKENPLEVFIRWVKKNNFIVILILTYIIIRFFVYFLYRL